MSQLKEELLSAHELLFELQVLWYGQLLNT